MISVRPTPVSSPGFYRMPEADYHADPCPEPSLSRSVAQVLLDQSAAHARAAHPRFTPPDPDVTEKNERRTDIGSAAHALLLSQPVEICVIDEKTYQKKAAQEERKAAYERGAIPLLATDKRTVDAMIDRAHTDLGAIEHRAIQTFQPHASPSDGITWHNEITGCWQDRAGGNWCRIRMDRLVIDEAEKRITIIDYKTTEMSAAPESVAKAIYNNAYHLQDGFYRRGVRQLIPAIDAGDYRLDFLFIVQEQDAPHEITVAKLDEGGRIIGQKMASAAVRLWDYSMKTGIWPGYPNSVHVAEVPTYIDTRWASKEVEDPRFDGLTWDPMPAYEPVPYRPKELVEPC